MCLGALGMGNKGHAGAEGVTGQARLVCWEGNYPTWEWLPKRKGGAQGRVQRQKTQRVVVDNGLRLVFLSAFPFSGVGQPRSKSSALWSPGNPHAIRRSQEPNEKGGEDSVENRLSFYI